MSSISVNTITDASGGSTTSINGFTPSVSNMAGRNRIINGDMRIDQRNAGASVTVTTGAGYIYAVDRFGNWNNSGVNYTAQRVTDAPVGFTNSVKLTFGSAISLTDQNEATFFQIIEGFNVADLGWGTANATAITVSLWVKASFTGANSIGFCNHNGTRAYATTYTINAANTWEFKTFVIPGDTTGAWLTDNSQGLFVRFNIAAGSNFQVSSNNSWATKSGAYNSADGIYGTKAVGTPSTVSAGATWQITGVQLEEGSVATPFCPAGGGSYGAELALCQRYYEIATIPTSTSLFVSYNYSSGNERFNYWQFKQTKRASPTVALGPSASWFVATAAIYPGVEAVQLYNSTTAFFIGGSAGVVGITASSEL